MTAHEERGLPTTAASRRSALDTGGPHNDTTPVIVSLVRALLVGSLIIGIFATAAPAHAQDVAAAEALFNEGRTLMEAGDTEAACQKFAESQRLDPSPGTALNLASCHQRLGRIASAWGEYLVAKRLARGQGRQAIAEEASNKAAELEPQLSYVKLNVQSPPDGLQVSIGDTELAIAALGSKLPVDPGPQTLRLSAPGYEPLEQQIEVGDSGTVTEVIVPPLKAETSDSPETAGAANSTTTEETGVADVPPTTAEEGEADHTLAYILGGVGIVGLAGGAVLGTMAISANAEAKDLCDGRTTNCPPETLDKSDEAKSYSTAGLIVGGVGIVSLGVAAVLYFSGDSSTETAKGWKLPGGSEVSWQVTAERTSVMLEGTF